MGLNACPAGAQVGAPGWIPGLDERVRESQAVIVVSEEGSRGDAGTAEFSRKHTEASSRSAATEATVSFSGMSSLGAAMRRCVEDVSAAEEAEVAARRLECTDRGKLAADRGKSATVSGSLNALCNDVFKGIALQDALPDLEGTREVFLERMVREGVLRGPQDSFYRLWGSYFGEDGKACWEALRLFLERRELQLRKPSMFKRILSPGAWMRDRFLAFRALPAQGTGPDGARIVSKR